MPMKPCPLCARPLYMVTRRYVSHRKMSLYVFKHLPDDQGTAPPSCVGSVSEPEITDWRGRFTCRPGVFPEISGGSPHKASKKGGS